MFHEGIDEGRGEKEMSNAEPYNCFEEDIEARHRFEHNTGDSEVRAQMNEGHETKHMREWDDPKCPVSRADATGRHGCALELSDIGYYGRMWNNNRLS